MKERDAFSFCIHENSFDQAFHAGNGSTSFLRTHRYADPQLASHNVRLAPSKLSPQKLSIVPQLTRLINVYIAGLLSKAKN